MDTINTPHLEQTTTEPGATRSVSPTHGDTHWTCNLCGGKPMLKSSRVGHLTTTKHLAAVADAAAAAEEALLAAEQTRKQAEEDEKIAADAQVKAALKQQKKQQKKMQEQELTDARAQLESVQNAAKQTNAVLQKLMAALAAASEENDKAEMAVMAAQEKVVALMS